MTEKINNSGVSGLFKGSNWEIIDNKTIVSEELLEHVSHAIYANSIPAGMGILDHVEGDYIPTDGIDKINKIFKEKGSIYLDYILGRCCKVIIRKYEGGRISISITPDMWSDHNEKQIENFYKALEM